MGLFDGKTPAERNKTIAALVLGAIAVLFLARLFLGGDSGKSTQQRVTPTSSTPPRNGAATAGINNQPLPLELNVPRPLPEFTQAAGVNVPEASRNIFAYSVAPQRTTTAAVAVTPPVAGMTPLPTPPPPPLMLSGVSPANIFARGGEFKLDVSGDKFTAESRLYIDNQEVPTSVLSAQQLSATVPASLIAAPGARSVLVRTPDGVLYSNTATLNVSPPPPPPFTYIGLLGNPRYSDKAILKPQQQNTDLLTVQRGDVVGGRYRVTSISERAVDFTDTQLSIKHTLPFVDKSAASGGNFGNPVAAPTRTPLNAPPPPADADDDDDKDEP